jgi:class 3 adenylate cyclase
MSAVRHWLEEIGLGQYADAFEANDIDMDLVTRLDDRLLKDIGVSSAGHRLRLRDAIAGLAPAATAGGGSTDASATAEASAPSAERRQLTVLFCDLVGSTALSARLDPEDLRTVIGAYHRCAAGVIERAGGFVAKYMGDGVLAYFGWPRADEHDAERAVHAGLALVEAVAGLDAPAEVPVESAGRDRYRARRGRRPDRPRRGTGAGGDRRDAEPGGADASAG